MRHGGDVEYAICRRGRGADGRGQLQCRLNFLFLARSEDIKVSAARAEINLAVGHVGRGPRLTLNLMCPIWFAGLCIHAMKLPPAVCNENQLIRYRRR